MAWRIQSMSEGPVILSDLGLTFTKGSIRDLDVDPGRVNAEQSMDIKLALQKGWVKQLEKSPYKPTQTPGSSIDPDVIDKLQETAQKAENAALQAEKVSLAQTSMMDKLEENNIKLQDKIQKQQEELAKQQAQNATLVSKSEQILLEVKSFIKESGPMDARVIAEALKNIKIERGNIVDSKESMESSGDSESEIKARSRILDLKDKKLEKNASDIGKSITKSADDIDDTLDALDALGL